MAGDDVTITVRVNNQTAAGFRDVNGQLRTLDGRFAATSNSVRRFGDSITKSLVDLKATLLSLAPAAVPVAASLAPLAVQAGAAGVAVAAFGAAVVPQIANMKSAADAQDKYTQAVTKYGANSQQAVQAQKLVADTLASMPAATQRAAAAYSNLRDQFKSFSDRTAKFTMVPVEHSFALLGALLPKLTPMVGATSTQLDRLMKVAGGAINTSAFDGLAKRFSDFANNSLKSATDGAIHFIRVLSEGNTSGPLTEFMAYAKAQGPAVKELLSNLVRAVGNIAQGAAEAGPGLLSLVNAFAKLIAAAPPQLIGNLMQIYAAFKLIKLAGAGIGAIAGGFTSLAGKITTLQAASTAAGGGLAGLKAAFLSLGNAAKATVVVAGITLLVVALSKLSSIGKQAPPDVDRMTTALANLGRTGKVTGEAARVFGTDLSGLADSLHTLARPSGLDKTQQFLTGLIGMDSTPVKKAKEDFDSIDKALSNLVRGGKADLAKTALDDITKNLRKQGFTSKEVRGQLDDYKSALADQALEQKLAAESMGVFGQAAQDTSAKLQAQKNSADALRQSIFALNDVNRSAYDSQIAFEQAVDDLTASFKKNGATLNLHTQAGRDNAKAMSDAAKSQDEMIASGVAAGDSLASMTKKSSDLRSEMLKLATEAFDGNKQKAQEYVNTLLGTPSDIKTLVELERKDAISGLRDLQTAIAKAPGAKSIKVSTLNGAAIKALEAVGLKTRQLPDGKTEIYTANGQALGAIGSVGRAMDNLNGKTATVTVMVNHQAISVDPKQYYSQGPHKGKAQGGLVGYADGGSVQAFPDGGYIQGPGTGTSDSILAYMGSGAVAAVSNTEYVMKAAAVRKYGVKMMDALNEGRLPIAHLAKGGLSQAAKDARSQLSGSFGISYYGRMAGYHTTPFEKSLAGASDLGSLVSALNDAASKIRAAFSGRTESSLLKHLSSVGKAMINYEKQLTKVTSALSSAKDKLNSLKDSASQLSSSVKSGILSSANITSGASGSTVSVGSIMGGLTQSRDQATALADALKQLQSKGLSSTLIQQIAEAGISGGGLETAGALLGASSSEIKSLNSLQSQINSAAGSAGKTTADSVYAKAIKDQTAIVNRLTKQQDKLEKAMSSLTKAMEKLIKQALKGKAAGGIVGAAASGGLRDGLTMVGEQGIELLDLPAGSRVISNPDTRRKLAAAQAPWASMLTTPRRSVPAATGTAPTGGDGQPLVIQVRIGERDFGELWVDAGRKAVRARGSIEATLRPPRGR